MLNVIKESKYHLPQCVGFELGTLIKERIKSKRGKKNPQVFEVPSSRLSSCHQHTKASSYKWRSAVTVNMQEQWAE